MKEYKLTLIGILLASTLYAFILYFNIELFEYFVLLLSELEQYQADEIIIPVIIILVFWIIDSVKRQKAHLIELEKVKIYKAMVISTNHVLNNFLNQLLLFKITAEKTEGFPPEIIDIYSNNIRDVQSQVEALGSLVNITEAEIKASVLPKV